MSECSPKYVWWPGSARTQLELMGSPRPSSRNGATYKETDGKGEVGNSAMS